MITGTSDSYLATRGIIHGAGLVARIYKGTHAVPQLETAIFACGIPISISGIHRKAEKPAGFLCSRSTNPVYPAFCFGRQEADQSSLLYKGRFAMNPNTTVAPVLSPVQFHEDTIYALEYEGQPYTPVKPIVTNLGLDWASQFTKLRKDNERWGCCDITIPSESGEQKYLCIPIRKIAGFLNSINSNRVKKDLKKKVELYQNECDDVLWNYWTQGKAINPRTRSTTKADTKPRTLTKVQLDQLDKELLEKMSCWNQENYARGRLAFHKTIGRHFKVERIDDVPEDKFDELLQWLRDQYHHPHRLGVNQDTDNHCPNIVDDLLQFVLYRVNAILVDLQGIYNETARHNITIELTMITSALGAAFPEEMQWLRFGRTREERQKQLGYNPEVAPKVEAFDKFLSSEGYYTLRGAFKVLDLKPNICTEKLREDGILYYLQETNVPYQKYLDQGLFVVKMKRVERENKEPKEYPQTYVTPKGLAWLREKYCKVEA